MLIWSKRTKLASNQVGLVSIAVTLFIITVISLMILGLATISRRSERQALDEQLSSQAYYAAESGVNDARQIVSNTDLTTKYTSNCSGPGSFITDVLSDNNLMDSTGNVKFTCLLVDPTPTSLSYGDIGYESRVVPVTVASGTISDITITWRDKDKSSAGLNGTCTAPTFPARANWTCPVGVMRVDLVPAAGSGLGRQSLLSNMFSAFLYPVSGGTSSVDYNSNYGTANQGEIIKTTCTAAPVSCSLKITGLNSSKYYLRLRTIYGSSAVDITPTDAGNSVQIVGAQAVIDATGKAADVVRRIQVRAPTGNADNKFIPDFALQSSGPICKQYSVIDNDSVTAVNESANILACKPT